MEGIKILARAGRPRSWQKFSKVSALGAPSVQKVTVEGILFLKTKIPSYFFLKYALKVLCFFNKEKNSEG